MILPPAKTANSPISKEHEQEIVDFVKSVNPKVESVQIDWNDVRRSDGMAFETEVSLFIFMESLIIITKQAGMSKLKLKKMGILI